MFRFCSPNNARESRSQLLPPASSKLPPSLPLFQSSSPFTVIFDVCLSVKYRKGEERESLLSI